MPTTKTIKNEVRGLLEELNELQDARKAATQELREIQEEATEANANMGQAEGYHNMVKHKGHALAQKENSPRFGDAKDEFLVI